MFTIPKECLVVLFGGLIIDVNSFRPPVLPPSVVTFKNWRNCMLNLPFSVFLTLVFYVFKQVLFNQTFQIYFNENLDFSFFLGCRSYFLTS